MVFGAWRGVWFVWLALAFSMSSSALGGSQHSRQKPKRSMTAATAVTQPSPPVQLESGYPMAFCWLLVVVWVKGPVSSGFSVVYFSRGNLPTKKVGREGHWGT